jgi:DNA-binding response OmpR family regulator
MRILLVEDTKDVAELLFEYFEAQGFDMDYAATGKQGLQLAQQYPYDVIILDVMLPGLSGYQLCQALRQQNNDVPIVMLTARDTQTDIIQGLNLGADDYVVKPFDIAILDARVKAAARRKLTTQWADQLQLPGLELNIRSRQLSGPSATVTLTPIQCSLLTLLMRNAPKAVSRAELERVAWPHDSPDTDLLRRYIYQLRSTLPLVGSQYLVETVPKFGYQLTGLSHGKS